MHMHGVNILKVAYHVMWPVEFNMVQPYQVMERPGFSNGNGSGEPVLNLTSNVQRGKGH